MTSTSRQRKRPSTPQQTKARTTKSRKEILAELKQDGCQGCGEADPVVLEFHHIEPKSFTLSHAMNVPWNVWVEEVAKCVCVCANCHRKIHAGTIELSDQAKRYRAARLNAKYGDKL